MKIGCVYSVDDYDYKLPNYASIPFGIATIATVLKHAGHDPTILVITPQTNISELIGGYIKENRPRLMCLTSVSSQYPRICNIAHSIKETSPSLTVILGGHHATLNPDESIKNSDFDAICIGEGEKAVVEYAARISNNEKPGGINNLWIKNSDDTVEKNDQDPFIQDLDSLPPIDMGLWADWIEDKTRIASILIARGCPNRCSYCSNHALAKVSKGKYVRFRSVAVVIGELKCLIEKNPDLESVFLEAETLCLKIDYLMDLCKALAELNSNRSKPIIFGTNMAVSKLVAYNEELMEYLRKANFKFVNIGLESGSERVRKEILRRPAYTNQEFLDFCVLAKNHEIDCNIFALIGIPGETIKDFQETIKMVRLSEPKHVYLSIFYPYPGTDLYGNAKEMGVLTDELLNPSMERKRALMNLPGFPKNMIQREYLLFPYKAFKGKRTFAEIAAMTVRMFIGTSPALNSIYRKATTNSHIKTLKKRFSPFNY